MDNIQYRVRAARLALQLERHQELKQYVEVAMTKNESKEK